MGMMLIRGSKSIKRGFLLPEAAPLQRLDNGPLIMIIAVHDKWTDFTGCCYWLSIRMQGPPSPSFSACALSFLHSPLLQSGNPKAVLVETLMFSLSALSNKSFSTLSCLGCAFLFYLCTHKTWAHYIWFHKEEPIQKWGVANYKP